MIVKEHKKQEYIHVLPKNCGKATSKNIWFLYL